MLQIEELIDKYSENFSTLPSLSSERQRLLWEVLETVHGINNHSEPELNLIAFSRDQKQYAILENVIKWLYEAQQQNSKNLKIGKSIEILVGFYKENALVS